MTMDNLVYTREHLGRVLTQVQDQLTKAAAKYDPAIPLGIEDLTATVGLVALNGAISDYLTALDHHGKMVRGEVKKDA